MVANVVGFDIPTIQNIKDRIVTDVSQNIPGADARVRRSPIGEFAAALSGMFQGNYQFQSFILRQAFPLTAEGVYLDYWARTWNLPRKQATKAEGTATFTGLNDNVIPNETKLITNDGQLYVITEEATITGGTATVTIESSDTGSITNRDPGAKMSLTSPLFGIQSQGIVVSLTGGSDVETDDELRQRLLARIANPPHGGSKADYEMWALQVPGVTRAFVYPLELGDGTVVVRFMMDDTYPDGIPEAGDVTTVADWIDPLRPVTAMVTVQAPVAEPINITIGELSPDTADIRTAIEIELRDMIRRNAVPGGTIYVSKIWEAVSIATGERSHKIVLPADNVVASDANHIATLGTVSFEE